MSETIGRRFMKETGYAFLEASDQEKGLPQPPLERRFEGGKPIELPRPEDLPSPEAELRQMIDARRSLRSFTDEALSLDELAYLLWCTQGVSRVVPGRATFRTVPSAGARHPFETILLVNRVDTLPAGLYHYAALEHQLVPLASDHEISGQLAAACHGQAMVQAAPVTFFWVADEYRTAWRYSGRSLRYIHLDAGHVCQNLYLAAESIGGGACGIAAFFDEKVNALLGLSETDLYVVYLAVAGKRSPAT